MFIIFGDKHRTEPVKDGLQIDKSPPNWVLRLSEIHARPYCLRYSTGISGIVLPSTDQTRNGLLEVMKVIESTI